MGSALDLIVWAKNKLEHSNIRCAGRDAEILFMDSFNMSREDIYSRRDFQPSGYRLNRFRHYVKLRALRYPLQYVLNYTEFMGLTFKLKPGVFIPRPETELLVKKVLEEIKSGYGPVRNGCQKGNEKLFNEMDILDIGTGCGNIAISLTKNVSRCRIIASDISDKALKVAAKNARLHGINTKIKFIKSDFFSNIPPIFYNYFDIIVSNPPYIRRNDLKKLQPEIFYEDAKAIDGNEDGLYYFRRILNEGIRYSKEGGIFAFEIGYNQAKDVARLIRNNRIFSEPEFCEDCNGYNRVVITRVKNGLKKLPERRSASREIDTNG